MKNKKQRLLLVDDDATLRISLQRVLQSEGYEVAVAGDGIDAIRVLEQSSIDLVITDLNMPGLDGAGLVNHLNQSQPELPVIVCSAQAEIYDIFCSPSRGLFLAKPLCMDTLLTAITALLAPGKAARAARPRGMSGLDQLMVRVRPLQPCFE